MDVDSLTSNGEVAMEPEVKPEIKEETSATLCIPNSQASDHTTADPLSNVSMKMEENTPLPGDATDLTEDEHDDTLANSPMDEDMDNKDVLNGLNHETDGTLSDPDDDGLELSDLEEDATERACQWVQCTTKSPSPSELTSHVLSEHIDDKTRPGEQRPVYHCKWDGCTHIASQRYPMIAHVRGHTQETPFFCFFPGCEARVESTSELGVHLSKAHDQGRIEELEWLATVDQMKLDSMQLVPKSELRSMKRITRMSDREAKRALVTAKVDFLKLQNVTVDDIVSEPLKKKGRTANAEINTEIREKYNHLNDQLKNTVLTQIRQSAQTVVQTGAVPTDEQIDSLPQEQLEQLHAQLERKLLWALEANKLLNDDLEKAKEEEHRWWSKKELLLDASVMHELPNDVDTYIPK